MALLSLFSPPLHAEELLEGELEIKFPYPLMGRKAFPTVTELARIAEDAGPRLVLLFQLYPHPNERAADRNDYYAPAWSPDGRSLFFLRADIKNRTSKIVLFPSLSFGRAVTLLDGRDSYDYMPSWMLGPAAGQAAGLSCFVFCSTVGPDENLDVYLSAAGQGEVKPPLRLTKGKVLRRYASLIRTDAGARLLFCDGRIVKESPLPADLSGLWGSEDAGDVSGRLGEAVSIGYGNYPACSPDGTSVVYAKEKGEEAGRAVYDLYLRRANGIERPLAAEPKLRVRTPAWSPDGKRVAFYAAKGEGGWGLFVVDAQTIPAVMREVADNVATEENFDFVGPSWLSSGKGLAYFVRSAVGHGHYSLRWSLAGKEAGGEIQYPAELTTANDLAVSPQRGVLEAAFVATQRLAQDVYVMILTEPQQ